MWPTILALAAAAVAAYTAVLKTKHEKLWVETYEKSVSALVKANIITRYLQSEENGEFYIHGLTAHEKNTLNEQWPIARYELARDLAYLGVLYPERDFERVNDAWLLLQGELFAMMEQSSPHDVHEYVRSALSKSRSFESALIKALRQNCVEPNLLRWVRKIRRR
ncbi:hypothetical protein [Pseudomonas sp. RGM 3321]|uniref:hypothetical protein n=1 Tax=Pseudomonas sp. RGM 3321 TaxID=2930089 RepID=UPI001FCC9F1B|nr:hypothetical protein [Pseudomonas sp. RGM 3321]MCJ2375133.1 hypothetical protein [Pseudomonas sp. RGM 3321]